MRVIFGEISGRDLAVRRENRVDVSAPLVRRIDSLRRFSKALIVSQNDLGTTLEKNGIGSFREREAWFLGARGDQERCDGGKKRKEDRQWFHFGSYKCLD